MDTDTPRKRLTRAESKARTRALLLAAAARTFARRGFAGASVEDIAEAAGFSIGALYSNFANKEELFLELCATYNAERIAEAAEVLEEQRAGGCDPVGAMGRVLIDAADKDGDFALLQAEFWLYAARNPQALEAISAQLGKPRAALEDLIAGALAERERPRAATPPAVAVVVAALFEGLVRRRRIDPDRVPEELFGHALRWLFAGIDATGRQAPARKSPRAAKT
jgi:AcrR family transcriptional regulator